MFPECFRRVSYPNRFSEIRLPAIAAASRGLLYQATNLKKQRVAMLLPGVELDNSRENHAPYGSSKTLISAMSFPP